MSFAKNSKKIISVLAWTLCCVGFGFSAFAQESQTPPPADSYSATATKKSSAWLGFEEGMFAQVGGIVGNELNVFQSLSAGGTLALGYQINPRFGLYARSDIFVTSKTDLTHLTFTFIPTVRATLINNLFAFVGLGYAMTHAPANSDLSGSVALIGRNYHSFTSEAGLGYAFFFNKRIGIAAEGGLNYTYLSKESFVSENLWRPFGRLSLSLQF